ncbi:MAG: hypothetical protein AB1298_06260, partial [Bacteroidota bacterium]
IEEIEEEFSVEEDKSGIPADETKEKPLAKLENENSDQMKVDLAEILEHKEMTRIIEVIFDYDIEDFAKMMDEISNCRNIDDAYTVINNTLAARRINRNSKEAETFRSIISEYFGHK